MTAKPLALIGGGGHALSLLDILPSPVRVAGYVDICPGRNFPLPYLGNDEAFCEKNQDTNVAITFVSGKNCSLAGRRRIIERYRNFDAPVIIAPTAIVSPSASAGKGCQIFHRAVIGPETIIGEYSIVNTGAIVEHGCRIGENVFIGPGAVICGGVTIGNDCYIGAGAVIRPGITICPETVIGAAAAVVKDILTPDTYAGIPAKPIQINI
ncbi:MAG: NeuD/PglB/VioB family sugar acetyltransferase [Duncaniella sp.]|nr:NeuD/PglB/VioB family sugar acetyltransferase [Duncaniella sp.]